MRSKLDEFSFAARAVCERCGGAAVTNPILEPERWRRIESLFQAAADLPPERRPAFLSVACVGDPDLRAQVEAMLVAEDQPATGLLGTLRSGARSMPQPVRAGHKLGPYEVIAPIGAGGMGEVWRARDPRLGRDVAVKLLPSHLAGEAESLARFEREARAVAALSHPNVLALYDVGDESGVAYVVTELLDGKTLRARLNEGPVPVRRVTEWIAQAAHGLAAAHDRGIVHRDVKPENLFLTDEGRVKVLDFGLARGTPGMGDLGDHKTTPGTLLGTVGYMSPEQLRCEDLDARSDVFSLGCVLYELLAGRRAFDGATPGMMIAAILQGEPEPIDTEVRPIPAALLKIVSHCLEKRREARFQSARDLAFALETVSLSSSSTRLPAPVEAQPYRRGPLALAAAAGVVLGSLAALALAAWLWRGEPQEPVKLRAVTYTGRDSWPAVSPDGNLLAFASERDGRSRIWLRQMAGGDEAALTEGADSLPRFAPDGGSLLFVRQRTGGGSDLWRVGALGGEPRRLVADATGGDWEPSGRQVVFTRERPGRGWVLGLASPDGGSERVLLEDARELESPRWSPDGERIAALRAGSVRGPDAIVVVEVASGRSQEISLPGVVWSLAWNGGEEVLYALAEGAGARLPSSQIVSHDFGAGTVRTLAWVPFIVPSLDVSGSAVVLTAVQRRQNLWQAPPGAERAAGRWLSRGNSTDRQPVHAPDGAWVAFASTRAGNLDLWSIAPATGAVHRLTDHPAEDWDPAFTPDGKKLLWSSNRSGHFEVWVAEADGSAPQQLTRDGVDAENPTATADGWVVYVSSNPQHPGIWKVRLDGSAAQRIVPGVGGLHPEVSPDGQRVVYHVQEGAAEELRLARLEDGAPLPFRVRIPLDTPTALRVTGELNIAIGRSRWRPDGAAVLFVGIDQRLGAAIFEQLVSPDGKAAGAPRLLLPSEGEAATESFGIAPDGGTLTVSFREQDSNLMLVEGVATAGAASKR
jgi:Tol biopolymer transport system component